MRFLFKFKFECKNCGRTSDTGIKVKPKELAAQELGEKTELMCRLCKAQQLVRITGLSATLHPIWVFLVITFFLFGGYLLISYLFENYWRPNSAQFNNSISVFFFGLGLPIVLLVFILRQIEGYMNRLNR